MALNRDDLKSVRQRKFLAKDFDGLRALLLEYARQYYPDRLRDFSESSVGGLLLDFAAYTGDVLSFYLDHQFAELDYTTAVENVNVERSLKTAGVPIVGAAPALVPVTAFIQVPAETVNNTIAPREDAIPIVQAGSIFAADNGTSFILLEDIDFTKQRSDGSLLAEIKVGQKTPSGIPQTFIMAASGLCISGQDATETVTIGRTFVPFRKITLTNPNISEIVSVSDGFGNVYYPVEALTHDVVYRNVLNTAKDTDLVRDSLKVIPAPYRYIVDVDVNTRRSTLTFGGGNADTLEDDVIPDPSDFAISFPYSKTFSRLPVNPQQLLQTKTLGVAAADTTLQINYRYGGGLNHNTPEGSIQAVTTLKMFFPGNASPAVAGAVRSSIEVTNRIPASGGEDSPTVEDLKALIPAIKNSQERIVTREDLLARVYTLPSNFGRVFRAAIRSNPNNPLASQLFIVSRDPQSRLVTSPDTLKQNLIKYLNPYRMISDAIDILDARIVNLTMNFEVLIDPTLNRSIVLQSILTKLQKTFDIKNFNIDQPIVISDINNAIFSIPGIVSITNIIFQNASGIINNRGYSNVTFDVAANTRQGILFPPGGGIFEIRYPEVDIVGKATV
jgi:hypothetical protein